jgi:hypothetical protein
MNATPTFIFVHMPKTGGSFVTTALRQLHHTSRLHQELERFPRLLNTKNWVLRQLARGQLSYEEFHKHGTCHDIPPRYAHLPIISCIRHPLDWYISNYKYGWWRTNPDDYPQLRQDPRWPHQIEFDTYLELSHSQWLGGWNPDIYVNPTLGRLTVLFINYYCRTPADILSLPPDTDTAELLARIQENMFPVQFLHTENLNQELYNCLLTHGYTAEQLGFILTKAKVSPRNQRRQEDTWDKFYTPATQAQLYEADRILFLLFPRYNRDEQPTP